MIYEYVCVYIYIYREREINHIVHKNDHIIISCNLIKCYKIIFYCSHEEEHEKEHGISFVLEFIKLTYLDDKLEPS
jgi:hypothetical protein